MATEVRLLGISESSIAIILDILTELYDTPDIIVHSNVTDSPVPNLPNDTVQYRIASHNNDMKGEDDYFWGTASSEVRLKIFNYFLENHHIKKSQYLSLVHPRSYVAPSARPDHGILVEPMAVVSSQSRIGFGVYIKRGALIGHHNHIGAFCDINPGVTLSGNVTIGTNTMIGSGCVIKDNIQIGAHSIIGAGSVVTKNIPDHVVAYGNPCKVIRKLEAGRDQ